MKKTILTILSIMIVFATAGVASAKVKATSPETAAGIKLYKAGNYTQSYLSFQEIVAKDPTNALAKYYFAMSAAQLGKKDQAIEGYQSVMALSPNGILGSYAKKGKRCLEMPTACHEPEVNPSEIGDTAEDRFIKGAFGSGFSKDARGIYEKQKIENLKREINRNEDIAPAKFKEYRDFSSQAPSNDEIVAALRVLQRAGLSDVMSGNRYSSDINSLLGTQSGSNNDILNVIYGAGGNNSNLSPQVIQALLTTQMTTNF